jgi:single-strand DNA-binding protein
MCARSARDRWSADHAATSTTPRPRCGLSGRKETARVIDQFGYPRIVVALEGQEFVVLRIEIIGNLGSDPEQRYTSEGVAMTSIRVAVNSRRCGADGESIERTDWFRARAMGSKAKYVQRFTKGQRVLVVGRLEIGEWQTREGETRTSYDIWADDVVNVSPREDGGHSQDESTSAVQNERPAQHVGAGARRASAEDTTNREDLPF